MVDEKKCVCSAVINTFVPLNRNKNAFYYKKWADYVIEEKNYSFFDIIYS